MLSPKRRRPRRWRVVLLVGLCLATGFWAARSPYVTAAIQTAAVLFGACAVAYNLNPNDRTLDRTDSGRAEEKGGVE